ncbi:hypothetical protein MRB53_032404 [Persea americana]|uniref:Uncharacterized protein n=1 Tax=Persea americana TaxID=3435 RepID=A0ACC2KRQ3_PERAE|nr:hypothetical protein MRB53_032404 [Persea americana]
MEESRQMASDDDILYDEANNISLQLLLGKKGSAAGCIAVSAIAGRCHLPSPPAQHRRRRGKPQPLLSPEMEENPDGPSQSTAPCPSLHDRRRRVVVAAL